MVKKVKDNACEFIWHEIFPSCSKSPFWHITESQVFLFKSNASIKADAPNQRIIFRSKSSKCWVGFPPTLLLFRNPGLLIVFKLHLMRINIQNSESWEEVIGAVRETFGSCKAPSECSQNNVFPL